MTLFSRRASSFDLAALLELFDADHTAIVGLLGAAIASIRISAEALENARDAAAIVDAAHRLKGTGSMIGATSLLDVSARIETAARAGDAGFPGPLLGELRATVSCLDADIRRTCHQMESDGV